MYDNFASVLLYMYKGKTRKRCGTCSGCTASDCGVCKYCRDKPKYGGPGRLKQSCEKRKCINIGKQVESKTPLHTQYGKKKQKQQQQQQNTALAYTVKCR